MKKNLHFIKKYAAEKAKRGFTLIETLVAITILLIAIVGPMEIASRALFSSYYARDQITAYYLAQEGIEYIVHDRDRYFLQNPHSTTWPSEFGTCVANGSNVGCKVDLHQPDGSVISSCGGTKCPVLNYDSGSGYYSYDAGTPTKFTSLITIDDPLADGATGFPSDDSITIHSTVTWTTSYFYSTPKGNSFTLAETLYRWQTK